MAFITLDQSTWTNKCIYCKYKSVDLFLRLFLLEMLPICILMFDRTTMWNNFIKICLPIIGTVLYKVSFSLLHHILTSFYIKCFLCCNSFVVVEFVLDVSSFICVKFYLFSSLSTTYSIHFVNSFYWNINKKFSTDQFKNSLVRWYIYKVITLVVTNLYQIKL